ncbi:hypothetical protein B0H34DRAFT_697820 [Crassisporium funariophilum]|nr:hypothetical protein B0H34DRAFT_697820 [Crassisporium funariophilum]
MVLSRAKFTLIASTVLLISVSSTVYFHGLWPRPRRRVPLELSPDLSVPSLCRDTNSIAPWDTSWVRKGPPTERFRDNLRNDTSYITTWSNAGFTNQFMNYVNMIYLGTLSDRVPILPPFAPDHHISSSAGVIPFADIFDLSHLRRVLQTPILEWRDVKTLPSHLSSDPYSATEIEDLGCWSTREESSSEPIRAENVVHHLGLDVSYTRVPSQTRFKPKDPNEPHVVFSQLAASVFPVDPIKPPDALPNFAPSPLGHNLPPDVSLTCYDRLYYATSGVDVYEWRFSWSPAWRTIARHLRFTESVSRLGEEYLLKTLGLGPAWDELPPFIAVHVRRGDFANFCSEDSNTDCLPPLSVYEERVEDVKTELMSKLGLVPENVLLMSDEKSPLFWEEVRSMGWLHINHTQERTIERFGEWYPPLIDIVAQSYAVGFVGTEDSTFSLISQRRVEDWNGGVSRTVHVRKDF